MDNGRPFVTADDSTTRWAPDSCLCILIYDSLGNFTHTQRRCRHHGALTGQPLVDAVRAHNSGFNERFGNKELTEIEEETIATDRRVEKTRITGLGAEDRFDENGDIISR